MAKADTTLYAVWKKSVITGDVNLDGVLDTTDVRLALKNIVGLVEFTAEQTQIADMNEDGKLNSADIRRMLLTITANAS